MDSVKDLFVSRYGDDGFIVELDLAQLEVMALAELTRDPTLIAELNGGVDIHRINAGIWLCKKPEDVTEEERKKAKVMTFQLTYGAGYKKIAATLNIEEETAQTFIETFLMKYSEVSKHFTKIKNFCKAHSYTVEPLCKTVHLSFIEPIVGRKHTVPLEYNEFSKKWSPSPTKCKNYPVQGFATGDLIPFIINNVLLHIEAKGLHEVKFVNTIHDSIMFDIKEDDIAKLLSIFETVFLLLKRDFKWAFDYDLKLNYTYDVAIGPCWGQTCKFTRKQIVEILEKAK